MIELPHPFTLILIINSLVSIGLILNQNDSTKDSTSAKSSSSTTNPFEKITWICLFIQLILLLLKTKLTDF